MFYPPTFLITVYLFGLQFFNTSYLQPAFLKHSMSSTETLSQPFSRHHFFNTNFSMATILQLNTSSMWHLFACCVFLTTKFFRNTLPQIPNHWFSSLSAAGYSRLLLMYSVNTVWFTQGMPRQSFRVIILLLVLFIDLGVGMGFLDSNGEIHVTQPTIVYWTTVFTKLLMNGDLFHTRERKRNFVKRQSLLNSVLCTDYVEGCYNKN